MEQNQNNDPSNNNNQQNMNNQNVENNQDDDIEINVNQFRRAAVIGNSQDARINRTRFLNIANLDTMSWRQLSTNPTIASHLKDNQEEVKTFLREKFPSFYHWAQIGNLDDKIDGLENIWFYREILYSRGINISQTLFAIQKKENNERTELEKKVVNEPSWNAYLPTGIININLIEEESNIDALIRFEDDEVYDEDKLYNFEFPSGKIVNMSKLLKGARRLFEENKPDENTLQENFNIHPINIEMETILNWINSIKYAVTVLFGDLFALYAVFENKLVDTQIISLLFFFGKIIRNVIESNFKNELIINENYNQSLTSGILAKSKSGQKLSMIEKAYLNEKDNNTSLFTNYTLNSWIDCARNHEDFINQSVGDLLKRLFDNSDKINIFNYASEIIKMFNIKSRSNIHLNKKYVKFKLEVAAAQVSHIEKKGRNPSIKCSPGVSLSMGTSNLFTVVKLWTEYCLAREVCSIDITQFPFGFLLDYGLDNYTYNQVIQILRDSNGDRCFRIIQFIFMIFPKVMFDLSNLNELDQVYIKILLIQMANDCIVVDKNLNRKVNDPKSDGLVRNLINLVFFLLTRGHVEYVPAFVQAIMEINPRSNFDHMMQIKKLTEVDQDNELWFSFYGKQFNKITDSIFENKVDVVEKIRRVCENNYLKGCYFTPLLEGVDGYSAYYENNQNIEDVKKVSDEFYIALGANPGFKNCNYSLNERMNLKGQGKEYYEEKINESIMFHKWSEATNTIFDNVENWIKNHWRLTRDIMIANYNHHYGKVTSEDVQMYYRIDDLQDMIPNLFTPTDNGLELIQFNDISGHNKNQNVVNNTRANKVSTLASNINNNPAAFFTFNRRTANQRFERMYGNQQNRVHAQEEREEAREEERPEDREEEEAPENNLTQIVIASLITNLSSVIDVGSEFDVGDQFNLDDIRPDQNDLFKSVSSYVLYILMHNQSIQKHYKEAVRKINERNQNRDLDLREPINKTNFIVTMKDTFADCGKLCYAIKRDATFDINNDESVNTATNLDENIYRAYIDAIGETIVES